MSAILKKQSRYKKYEQVALLNDYSYNRFVVDFHYIEDRGFCGYGNTPSQNTFFYTDENSKLAALKSAIALYESIRT